MNNPTVKQIIEDWLVANGYTGLFCDQCGCEIDDLMPCAGWDNGYDMCHPGYKHNCPATCEECSYNESCDMDRSFTSWYITGDK